jgi:hypothetical protein
MPDPDRVVQAQVADLAAVIERTTADLSLPEEAASFIAALEEGASDD